VLRLKNDSKVFTKTYAAAGTPVFLVNGHWMRSTRCSFGYRKSIVDSQTTTPCALASIHN
jgi:hypothetical protein